MHEDHQRYYQFTGKSRIDKATNSLLGLLEGITADSKVSMAELQYLQDWVAEHEDVRKCHPFNELLPQVEEIIADGVITEDERADLAWLCDQLRSTKYFDEITADLQRLHGVMAGIVSDGVVTADELRGLCEWIEKHEHLRTCWPFDEVDTLTTSILADGTIDEEEHHKLRVFFSEFLDVGGHRAILEPPVSGDGRSLKGLCSVCPQIKFDASLFCFTGASTRGKRSELAAMVKQLGGQVTNRVGLSLDYLVIGAAGNPCWAYACYGRKVEEAVQLRRQGCRILLIHEHDFFDSVADAGRG